MHLRSTLSIAVLVAAGVTAPAMGAVTATAVTALNMRSGPGPQYPVVGFIRDNDQAIVTGCIQGSRWCEVNYNGSVGWAYSRYLAMDNGGQTVVVAQEPSAVPIVTYQAPATAVETVGSAPPPIAGTVVETDAAPIVAAPPPETVSTYVEGHPLQPVYLNGEVVVGAGLPETVALQPVPDYQYDYAYVNSVPVLVEPSSRRIVYVYQ